MDPTEVIPPRVDTISTWTYIHTAEAILRATRVRMLGLLLHFDKQWGMCSLCRFKRLYLARFCIGSLIILGSWLVYRVQMSCYTSHCNEEQVHPTFKISEAKFRQLIRCFCLDLNACHTSSLIIIRKIEKSQVEISGLRRPFVGRSRVESPGNWAFGASVQPNAAWQGPSTAVEPSLNLQTGP